MISPDYYKGSIDEYIKKIEYSLQRHSIKIMQYRNHSSPIDIFKVIADRLQQICNKRSITFIINNRMGTTDNFTCDGFHLGSQSLKRSFIKIKNKIYGASCHNEQEIKIALAKNINYIFLSPVKKTQSHKDACPIGWDNFKKLATKYKHIKIYALGGMQITDKKIAEKNNAYGIAGIGCFNV